jgi:tetratricopeptide (TPR) repeat protein
MPEAYIIWGSALDEEGKWKQSLQVYEEGLQYFPSEYLLHYNQGFTLYRNQQYPAAELAFSRAIEANPTHPGSHLLLGLTEQAMDRRTGTILPLCIFLLLEPQSERSGSAWETLAGMQVRNLNRSGKQARQDGSGIFEGNIRKLDERAEEALLAAQSTPLSDTSMLARFALRNSLLFNALPDSLSGDTGIWHQLYLPFFKALASSGQSEAFSYYISQGVQPEGVKSWFSNNPAKSASFSSWFAEQEFLK